MSKNRNVYISENDRKLVYDECQRLYKENYLNKFDWLPELIENVTSDQIRSMGTIYGVTGVDIVTPFLKLRETILKVNN